VTGVLVVAWTVLAAVPWGLGPRAGARAVADGIGAGPGASSGHAVGEGCDAGVVAQVGRRQVRSRVRGSARASSGAPAEPGTGLLLALVAAALAAGAPVVRALEAVGEAWPGADGPRLVRAAHRLSMGASWTSSWAETAGGAVGGAAVLARALEPSWTAGGAAGPVLDAAADAWRRRRRVRAREAAARLGVHLLLPVGLCLLPAFVLLGVVPVVLSLASGLLR
jgi:hypothetical protein